MKHHFDGLIKNALNMAGSLVSFDINIQSTPLELSIDKQLSTAEGIPIYDLSVLKIDAVTGTFDYKGRNVVLYIPDHSYWNIFEQVLSGNLSKGRRFHLTFCSKLKEMKNTGRFEKYHVNQNKETLFQIVNGNNETAITPLWVCKCCLEQLNYQNYNNRKKHQNKIRDEFDFNEFLQTYTTHFNELPDYVGQDKGGYTTDWVNVSTMYRARKNYVCEKCGVDLSTRKGLLHTHHKNGVKHDNRFDNLQALCVLCHGDEPFHGHMSSMVQRAKADILALRQMQNLQGN